MSNDYLPNGQISSGLFLKKKWCTWKFLSACRIYLTWACLKFVFFSWIKWEVKEGGPFFLSFLSKVYLLNALYLLRKGFWLVYALNYFFYQIRWPWNYEVSFLLLWINLFWVFCWLNFNFETWSQEYVVETCSGYVSVSVYGDQDKPALVTYPDFALNRK